MFLQSWLATHPRCAFHANIDPAPSPLPNHGTHQEQLLPPTHPLSPLLHLPPPPLPCCFLQLLIAAPPPPRSSRGTATFRGVQAQGECRIDEGGAANRLPDIGLGGRRGEFEKDAEGSVPSVEPLRGALGP